MSLCVLMYTAFIRFSRIIFEVLVKKSQIFSFIHFGLTPRDIIMVVGDVH